ncbi:major facilitator superfamily domain-containing protein [Coniochaeta sp. 2T2.1]|nr:major facilitator superfamily domain-containing protein [Coniochaeta sp. 2T2.1]
MSTWGRDRSPGKVAGLTSHLTTPGKYHGRPDSTTKLEAIACYLSLRPYRHPLQWSLPRQRKQTAPLQLHGEIIVERPFTVFTQRQKTWINLAASWAAMFSTTSSYIYYPAIVPLARDLGVTVLLLNLTMTSYLVMAAIAPAFMGDLADQTGRRPIYILIFTLLMGGDILIFTLLMGGNIGIVLQNSFPVLLVLRMVQATGASGLSAVAYGVISDVTVAKERGGYVGMPLSFVRDPPVTTNRLA